MPNFTLQVKSILYIQRFLFLILVKLIKIGKNTLSRFIEHECKHPGVKCKSDLFVLQEVMLVRLPLPLLPTPPLDMFSPQWVHSQEARSQQTWLASSPQQATLKCSHHILTSGFRTPLRGSLAGQQYSFLLTGKAAVNSCMVMGSTLDICCLQCTF